MIARHVALLSAGLLISSVALAAETTVEAGAGLAAGSYSDGERPEDGSRPFGGGTVELAAETTLPRGWYARGYASSTPGIDGSHPRMGAALGGHWRYGELAGGAALVTLGEDAGTPAMVLPSLYARLGAETGPQLDIGIVDERGPLHALVGASAGWRLRSGVAMHAGVGVTEEVAAAWGELRIPLEAGGTIGLYAASGSSDSDYPSSWHSFGARIEMRFGAR